MPSWGSILGRFGGRLAGNTVSQTVGYATGQAAAAAIMPEVQPIANELWELNPNIPLSPNDAAQMVVQSIMEQDSAASEAAKSGLNGSRFDRLVRLAGDPPGPETILAMWDRKIIDRERARLGLLQSRLKPEWVDEYLQMQRDRLTAPTLAEMVVQGITTEEAATQEARLVSIEPEDFHRMVALAGSPPGPMEALEMWRRNIIDDAEVRKALLQSRLKPEWVDEVMQLKNVPLSASVAAELVLKGLIPFDRGMRYAAMEGLSRDDFELLSEANGRPPATGQALTLARRGELSKERFTEFIARSNVRTEFADDLWKLRRVIPPLFQIIRLLQAGSITAELATTYVVEQGYDKELAAAIVDAAKKGKTQHTRDLSAGMIDVLYESGLQQKEWAMEALTLLGYDDDEAAMHLMILDARRLLAAEQANLNVIHRMYVTHKYDIDTAAKHLEEMGIDSAVREQLLETWTHERNANVTRLSNAQIGSALKKGVIPESDAIARWMTNGYPREDAEILAQLAQKTGHPASPTAP